MPIYMDRHDVPETITAKDIAHMHKEDIKIQHLFNCRALTYWFDDKRKTAFCLIDAPHAKNIEEMHNSAHGQIPHEIIEVDASVVESFLGRIEDPVNEAYSNMNIIDDPAFRAIMAIRLNRKTLNAQSSQEVLPEIADGLFDQFDANVVRQNREGYLLSFKSVTRAVNFAIALQSELKNSNQDTKGGPIVVNIGLSAGLPVSGSGALFNKTIQLAERMCHVADKKIVLTTEVKDLYKNENSNRFADSKYIVVLSIQDENFLNQLMDFVEAEWHNHELRVNDFNRPMGLSKSQLYRRMIDLLGLSPANFLKEYRLDKALGLIRNEHLNISEVAFSSGFNSLSYFSKCFRKHFGQLPSTCLDLDVH